MFDTYENIFNRRADSYDEAMARCPEARREEFEMALAPLPLRAGAVLCDMPAGGAYLRRYLPEGLEYLAVEPSDQFFARCPEESGARRLQCPLASVPLADHSVDYVVSLAGLHHAPDLDAIFAEMRRLVRPEGWVVIADVQAGSASDRFLNGFVDRHNPMGHKGVFFDAATPARLRGAKLQVVDDRTVLPQWSFADLEEMGGYCRSLFGIDLATAGQVAASIESLLEVRSGPDGVGFGWPLRRFVCRPAPG